MRKIQNDELVKLMGGNESRNANNSYYTLAGSTIIANPTTQEMSDEEDTAPDEDDII